MPDVTSDPQWTNTLPLDTEAKLHQLEMMVAEAKAVPLSASIMVNRADVESLVNDLRAALPDEIRRARWILKERDDVLDKARREAAKIIEEAETERDRLISRTDVMAAAEREADRVLDEAEEHARQIRLEAEDYVDAKLANFEVVLQRTLDAVERGREKLQGRLEPDDLVDLQTELDDGWDVDQF
jgi:vacuolar-type H+-ATPase subunit H